MATRFAAALSLFAMACDDKQAVTEPARPDAPPALVTVRTADAAAEAAEPPLPPMEVLGGIAAEKAIAELPAPPPEPSAGPRLLVGPNGVGPFRLGLPRNAALALKPPRFVSLSFSGGRLVEVDVTAHGAAAVTDGDIGVGSTLAQAVEAHGPARPSGPGVVLEDLPGVIFVVKDGTIVRIAVVGPESD